MNNEEIINNLQKEKRRLQKSYYNPGSRRMNGKPTATAFDNYGKRIIELNRHIAILRGNPFVTPTKEEKALFNL